jgi:hypothetical protein
MSILEKLKSVFAQNSVSKENMWDILRSPLEESICELGHIWEKFSEKIHKV